MKQKMKMIDIKEAEKVFMEYAELYDAENLMIKRKIEHTFRVEENSKLIAESLKLNEEESALATLIGLLHDIGRFEQQRIANSYNDLKSGIDHASMGVKVLFEDEKIKDFIPDTREYDQTIKNAIEYHNKFKVPDELPEKDKMFCKIIRDADKLDILEIFVINGEDTILIGKNNGYEVTPDITKEFLDALFQGKQIDRKYQKYFLDWYLNTLTFLFDINYAKSFEIIKDKKYIDITIELIEKIVPEDKEIFEKIREYMNNYIKERI